MGAKSTHGRSPVKNDRTTRDEPASPAARRGNVVTSRPLTARKTARNTPARPHPAVQLTRTRVSSAPRSRAPHPRVPRATEPCLPTLLPPRPAYQVTGGNGWPGRAKR
jgi:hypothetical protein